MSTFSKFMSQVKSKLVSENLMTDAISNALDSIDKPQKRTASKYNLLMKNILNEVITKYPDVVHKTRFRMAAQISGLIHKSNTLPELAWKIVIQRNLGTEYHNDDDALTNNTHAHTTSHDTESVSASSGVMKKRRHDENESKTDVDSSNDDAAVIEVELEDLTNTLNNSKIPEHVITSDNQDDKNAVGAEGNEIKENNDATNIQQVLREYVKGKLPKMHVNDRYKIVNKMKKLVKSVHDTSNIENAYIQVVN